MNCFTILLILSCIILVIMLFAAVPKNTSKQEKTWNNSFNKIYTILNNLNREWWICEGTLIGALRYGNNFGYLPSYGKLATDTDIDIMIRIKNKKDWLELINKISKDMGKDWYYKEQSIGYDYNKCVFSMYNKVFFLNRDDYDIHIDIHPYFVDEIENIVYTSLLCKKKRCNNLYPFQKWGGSVPYKGFIVNDNGEFKKGLLHKNILNIPYKYLDILGKWNNNEYRQETLHLPVENPLIYKNNKWTGSGSNEGSLRLAPKDMKTLDNYKKTLKKQGFASF